jgi:lysophospholipid acyltransferase
MAVKMWELEVSSCVKDFLAAWNISTQSWLKYYVYLRLLPNKKDDKSRNSLNVTPMIATFAVSAIWHGFYSGYFVFFTSVALLDI